MSSHDFWRQASVIFAAGALGGLATRIAVWLFGVLAVIPPPEITKLWIYTGLVWGGIWAFIFLIPWRASWWLRGLVFGIGPSLGIWLVIQPYVAHIGFFGLSRGIMSIVVPLIVNSVAWGLVTSGWYEWVNSRAAAP